MIKNNFISLYQDVKSGLIYSWEKTPDGKRVKRTFKPKHYFYVPNRLGTFKSLTGQSCEKIFFDSAAELSHATLSYPTKWESDFTPLERTFQENYAGLVAPKLIAGFVDLEVFYTKELGFAGPKNPYGIINALTLIISTGQRYTLGVPPNSLDRSSLDARLSLQKKILSDSKTLKHLELFESDKELLERFLELLEPVDVISGWNSEFYDLPYIGKRIQSLLGNTALAGLEFPECKLPRWTEKDRFKGSKEKDEVLELSSRVHLDYLKLFRKFNLTTRSSFKLDAVCQEELGEQKTSYPGTLAELYQNDFQLFLEYNLHDSALVEKLDKKFKYIELANEMVHEATVNFPNVFGSVQLIDSAIINYAHLTLNVVVNDRVSRVKGPPVEGAVVMTPNPGLYKYIGVCDINSLYPSNIRSLNLSTEKIIGQLAGEEDDWRYFYEARSGNKEALEQIVTIRLETGDDFELSIKDLIDLCESQKYAISGFGTILDQSNGLGILPSILTFWFNDRKALQSKKKDYSKKAEMILKTGIKLDPEQLKELK